MTALAVLSLAGAAVPPLAAAASPPALGPVPAAAAVLPSAAPAARFRLPVDGPVVRRFAPPPEPWLPGHRGVDLAAAPGAVVHAAGAGVVHFAGWVAGRGVVSVSHSGGLRTTYEPVEPQVTTGDRVAAGDRIGVLSTGHAGCPAPACLHWGLRRNDEYLDPLALLQIGRLRLLPVRSPRSAPAGPSAPTRLRPRRVPGCAWRGRR
jgi:murein DD-endopeptidase MepM/ murein hydrolase activator NlpD